MKLIATKDFANVGDLKDYIDEKELKVHPRHVHKGHVFAVGSSDKLKDCTKKEQQLIAQLYVSGSVGDAGDAKVVKSVQDEIAADKRREANDKAAQMRAETSGLSAALQELLLKAAKTA